MSPEARERWTQELEAAGVPPAEAEQYVQGLQQLALEARGREVEHRDEVSREELKRELESPELSR